MGEGGTPLFSYSFFLALAIYDGYNLIENYYEGRTA